MNTSIPLLMQLILIQHHSDSYHFVREDNKHDADSSPHRPDRVTALFQRWSLTYTLKRISNWSPSFFYILVKVFGEKYKIYV